MFFRSRKSPAAKETPISQKETPVNVDLWNMAGVGIVIPYSSGIIYTNQVGGNANRHPSVEGVFVPLSSGGHGSQNCENNCPLAVELFAYFFNGPKWKGRCYLGAMDGETADYVDTLLKKYRTTKYIQVDRNRLKESSESWVHVNLKYPAGYAPFSGLSSNDAILTWLNSD